jgi:hypothetical protein
MSRHSAKGGATSGGASGPDAAEAANPMWANGFGESRGETRTPDPGIMRNGGTPRSPALPGATRGAERHRTARPGADDSAKDGAGRGTSATARPRERGTPNERARARRAWRLARLVGGDWTHAPATAVRAVLALAAVAHPGRRGWA